MVARRNHTMTPFEELVIRAFWFLIKALIFKQQVGADNIDKWRDAAVETGSDDRGPDAQERWKQRLS